MAKLVAAEKKSRKIKENTEQTDAERANLLKRYLASDAQSYLIALKQNASDIGAKVEEIILDLIIYRGVRQTISQLDVRYIERQVTGEKTKIRVQRDGETSDFGSYVRDAIREGKETISYRFDIMELLQVAFKLVIIADAII